MQLVYKQFHEFMKFLYPLPHYKVKRKLHESLANFLLERVSLINEFLIFFDFLSLFFHLLIDFLSNALECYLMFFRHSSLLIEYFEKVLLAHIISHHSIYIIFFPSIKFRLARNVFTLARYRMFFIKFNVYIL